MKFEIERGKHTNFYSGLDNSILHFLNICSSIHYYTQSSSRVRPNMLHNLFYGLKIKPNSFSSLRSNLIVLPAKDQTYANIFLFSRSNLILLWEQCKI